MHNVILHSDLFEGQVTVAVRPALPIEGITLILGKGVTGGHVWAGVPPPPAVSLVPLVRKQPDENEMNFPEIFSTCAVTRSRARDKLDSVSGSEQLESNTSGLCAFSLSDTPLSVSQEDLRLEQQADPSLKGLFEQVLPADEVQITLEDILCRMRCWLENGYPTGTASLEIPLSRLCCHLNIVSLC